VLRVGAEQGARWHATARNLITESGTVPTALAPWSLLFWTPNSDGRAIRMPDSQSPSNGPSLLPIERPRCPTCHNRMNLAQVMPGRPGFDVRTFECGRCEHAHILTVATDPMKSDKIGWLAGELKPPE
jgi:hypothetical protein